MITRVLICLGNNPSRSIGNSLSFGSLSVRWMITKKMNSQDTRPFLEGPEYEVSALLLQRWCPSPTSGDKEDRYKKSVVSSEIAQRKSAKISHYSQLRVLFEAQNHHDA